MGNGQWGIAPQTPKIAGEWGIGNGQWAMGNSPPNPPNCGGMGNREWAMGKIRNILSGNGEWGRNPTSN